MISFFSQSEKNTAIGDMPLLAKNEPDIIG